MQLILSGHVDGLRARADVGRAGAGIEPNVPVPPERAGHGVDFRPSHVDRARRLTARRDGRVRLLWPGGPDYDWSAVAARYPAAAVARRA